LEREIKGKKEKFYRYHHENIKIFKANILQGVENYAPWCPCYLQRCRVSC
jgi:hypothetical protein